MINVKSYIANPLLEPNPKNEWESIAVFNGSVIKDKKKYLMVYRAIGQKKIVNGKEIRISTIGMAESEDKYNFKKRKQLLVPEYEWEKFGLEDPRITKIDNTFYIFYTAIGNYPTDANGIKVAVAKTKDFKTWEKHLVTDFNAKAMTLFPRKIDGKFVAVLAVNTDRPPARIGLITFEKENDIWNSDYWRKWFWGLEKNTIRLERVNSDLVEIGAVPIETKDGWVLIYCHIENYFAINKAAFGIEAVLLDINNPLKILGQTITPFMLPQEDFELSGIAPNIIFPSGAVLEYGQVYIYYGAADNYCAVATINLAELMTDLKKNGILIPQLKRYEKNPIIQPRPEVNWEAKATFNPGAVEINGKIFIIYRAVSKDNTSSFGLAITTDGFNLDWRSDEPIYTPKEYFEVKDGEDNFSGCEDPRITRIGDRIYVCYTAFNSKGPPKVAFTSILVSDFLKRNWNWKKSVIISDEGKDNKDACLFPERIGNKYIFFHRLGGKGMTMSFMDSIDFENNEHLTEDFCLNTGKRPWKGDKTGIATPPLKTNRGWFLLYHGVSDIDRFYRVGALLLDLEHPYKVIGHTRFPILEPEANYEKIGDVNNVVFPCGMVVKNGELLVYYGAADKVIGVAMGNFDELINELARWKQKTDQKELQI
ncbi:MAG: hypothetical protein PHP97_03725 [Candidatus Shapirobacteria bacterium]|nr:hypothetical protein [Candidatus Shapirobacteria bacterium]MDD4383460.1 hypothetical protein [Candidatus Shapirobacteria bacterium]